MKIYLSRVLNVFVKIYEDVVEPFVDVDALFLFKTQDVIR